MTVQRIDSHIEERARLVFIFPQQGTDEKRILPFFENVTIKESKKARLVKYQPMGRSSNHFGYLGADSRKISLSFNMTLPNIQSLATAGLNSNLGMRRADQSVEALQQSFFENFTGQTHPGGLREADAKIYEKKWYKTLGRDFSPGSDRSSTEESQLMEFLDAQRGAGPDSDKDNLKYKMIDTIVYWANLIRASVLNNARNPFYGPPIVRLTYGILYRDIPCVCESYRIQADDKAGYDQRTMLPRVIGVTMDLQEVREGDRGCFEPSKPIKRDNLAGWESVVDTPRTLDPLSLEGTHGSQVGRPKTAKDSDHPEGAWRDPDPAWWNNIF